MEPVVNIFSEKITMYQRNLKESWKTINHLPNKRSKTTNIKSLLGDNSNNIIDKQEMSKTMSSYFCSIGKDLANEIEERPNPLLIGQYFINWNVMERLRLLKDVAMTTYLAFFLNLHCLSCQVPSHTFSIFLLRLAHFLTWKVARFTPIFKEGDKSNKSDYHPISVLSVLARLFEKLAFDQLYHYLDANGLLSPQQSGFRAHHSTATSLPKCTDDWYNGHDTGQMTGIVLIDLKKAFDTVDHDVLSKKLIFYGVHNRELEWFKSYLPFMKKFTRVNRVDSKVEEIEIGVP